LAQNVLGACSFWAFGASTPSRMHLATHLDSTVVRRLVWLQPDRMSTIRHRAATTRNKNQITCYLSPMPSRLQHCALAFSLMLPVSECSFKASGCCRFHCPSRISRPDMRPPTATSPSATHLHFAKALLTILYSNCAMKLFCGSLGRAANQGLLRRVCTSVAIEYRKLLVLRL
jgi:hypothetical protein